MPLLELRSRQHMLNLIDDEHLHTDTREQLQLQAAGFGPVVLVEPGEVRLNRSRRRRRANRIEIDDR